MSEKCSHYDYILRRSCSKPRAPEGSFGYPYDHYCFEHAQAAIADVKSSAQRLSDGQERQQLLESLEATLAARRAKANTDQQPEISQRFLRHQYLVNQGSDPTKFAS
jgi:hypothetical protein